MRLKGFNVQIVQCTSVVNIRAGQLIENQILFSVLA